MTCKCGSPESPDCSVEVGDASIVAAPGDGAGVQSEPGVRGRDARLPQAGPGHRQSLHQEHPRRHPHRGPRHHHHAGLRSGRGGALPTEDRLRGSDE